MLYDVAYRSFSRPIPGGGLRFPSITVHQLENVGTIWLALIEVGERGYWVLEFRIEGAAR